jgi:hypothetical protein
MHCLFVEVTDMDSHQTKSDAHDQIVFHGTMGSLAGNCSREYLMHLRADCYAWIERMEAALAKIDAEEARLDQEAEDFGEVESDEEG